ncbi:MAG: sirohydrochlorin ferrochelatase [Verrucomicrobiales bacterium]|jgi:sirohydrochlorin ferrochelatase
MSSAPAPCITLTDNGSLRPEATFSLRQLAKTLGERVGHPIHAVSLLHSNRIPAEKLDDVAAETFEKFAIARHAEHGTNDFLVSPLFFGPSAAIAEYLPQRVDVMMEEHDWPKLRVRVAPCLVDLEAKDDYRMAEILAELVRSKRQEMESDTVSVGLVDHGTPRITVTQVRNFLAEQLKHLLGEGFDEVRPCSMERREGSEYDYNEPLLERLLGQPGYQKDVIVSMLFLQPGRHAGAGGDVAEICGAAEKACPGLRTHMTDLVGTHPALIDLLAERLEAGFTTDPVSWKVMTSP